MKREKDGMDGHEYKEEVEGEKGLVNRAEGVSFWVWSAEGSLRQCNRIRNVMWETRFSYNLYKFQLTCKKHVDVLCIMPWEGHTWTYFGYIVGEIVRGRGMIFIWARCGACRYSL